ncbi:MAG TPA: hypothetical protein VGM10_33205 [Actinocrinis sp.]
MDDDRPDPLDEGLIHVPMTFGLSPETLALLRTLVPRGEESQFVRAAIAEKFSADGIAALLAAAEAEHGPADPVAVEAFRQRYTRGWRR